MEVIAFVTGMSLGFAVGCLFTWRALVIWLESRD